MITIVLAENISIAIATFGLNLSMKEIFSSVFLRISIGWIHLALMVVVTFILLKKKVSLISAVTFFQLKSKSGKITLFLIILVIIQALLAVSLNLVVLYKMFGVWPSFDNVVFTRVVGFLLFTIPLLSIILVKRLSALSEQEAIAETQEAFMDNINNLFITIRAQRHDFIHHVQVIYSMLNTNQVKEAIQYMDNLLDEIQSVTNVIRVKDPVLSALFNTKTAIAERHNVKLEIKLETLLEGLNLKPFEAVKILGNLIDNAIEAAATQPAEYRFVKVTLKAYSTFFVFEVFNPRPAIAASEINKVFESGFSTKENHSGLGLAVVKDLVERHEGEISVKSSEEEGTTFTVVLPVK